MAPQTCSGCGAPVSADAQFCTYCGTPVGATSAPLPSAAPSPGWTSSSPPPSPYVGPSGAPPRRRRSRVLIIVVVVVVVLLVVSIVGFALLYTSGSTPAIQVGEIVIWTPGPGDNVCGLYANQIAYYGYNSSTSQAVSIEFEVPNYNSTVCTIHSVITNSTGFVLSGVQLPGPIPANPGTGPLNLTVTSPSSSFSGDLNLVFA